jgi:hypothetical protein
MFWMMLLVGCFSGESDPTGDPAPIVDPTEPNAPTEPSTPTEPTDPGESNETGTTGEDASPPQLEAFTVFSDTSYSNIALDGMLSVIGADRDWELNIGGEVLMVHSPGQIDFSAFDGLEVALDLSGSEWSNDDRTLTLYDERGLAYVGGAHPAEAMEALWGRPIVSYGEATFEDWIGSGYGTSLLAYGPVDVQTDQGSVSVFPGEPTAVVLDGESWELTVLAAYQVLDEVSDIDCQLRTSVLSLEMVRVDSPRTEWIERPADLPMASYGCG